MFSEVVGWTQVSISHKFLPIMSISCMVCSSLVAQWFVLIGVPVQYGNSFLLFIRPPDSRVLLILMTGTTTFLWLCNLGSYRSLRPSVMVPVSSGRAGGQDRLPRT